MNRGKDNYTYKIVIIEYGHVKWLLQISRSLYISAVSCIDRNVLLIIVQDRTLAKAWKAEKGEEFSPGKRLSRYLDNLWVLAMSQRMFLERPIYDENGWKTLPFGAAHTYIVHIREYLPRRAFFTNLKCELYVSLCRVSQGYFRPFSSCYIDSFQFISFFTSKSCRGRG